MSTLAAKQLHREALVTLREYAAGAFSRAAGAPLVHGNKVKLLRDATENYPAWLQAIGTATRTIHFESYIIHADDIGQQFREALAAKAREGVRVRLIYDWLGSMRHAPHRFWTSLRRAGIEVRCFNPPRLDSPMGWLRRDHRKMLSVDGRVGFVSGLCVGRRWVGRPEQGIEPWRDTGVEITGPAVTDLEDAFAHMWALLGVPIPVADLVGESNRTVGDVALRVVASYPNMAGLYRFDQLIAALAQRSIWLADAYFLGTAPYLQALRGAALDGVDVRLLLPQASDVPIVRSLSRTGYRTLLEAGVRIFEWNGPMMHAKTAVADGRWTRVGSTNLNLASWLGNWELDVVAEDESFAEEMEKMYLEDLARSTEIVLSTRKVRAAGPRPPRPRGKGIAQGSARSAVTSLMRVGNTVGAAITSRRALGPAEIVVMVTVAALLLGMVLMVVVWPLVIVVPAVIFMLWIAVSLLIRALRLHATQRAAKASNEDESG